MTDKKTDKKNAPTEAHIASRGVTCTIEEIYTCCGTDITWVQTIVAHGIIEPIDDKQTTWHFTQLSALRAAKARRLERDLEINMPGVAVVLELLDEIENLKTRLRRFE